MIGKLFISATEIDVIMNFKGNTSKMHKAEGGEKCVDVIWANTGEIESSVSNMQSGGSDQQSGYRVFVKNIRFAVDSFMKISGYFEKMVNSIESSNYIKEIMLVECRTISEPGTGITYYESSSGISYNNNIITGFNWMFTDDIVNYGRGKTTSYFDIEYVTDKIEYQNSVLEDGESKTYSTSLVNSVTS